MRNDMVEMTVHIVKAAISHDLTEDGWESGIRLNYDLKALICNTSRNLWLRSFCSTWNKENDYYVKTWTAAEFTDDEKSVNDQNYLVLAKSINTDCPKEIELKIFASFSHTVNTFLETFLFSTRF